MSVKPIKTKNPELTEMMEEVDVGFISLVGHGANGRSFRVLKNTNTNFKTGSVLMKKLCRVVCQQGTVSIEDFVSKNSWAAEIGNVVKNENGGWVVENSGIENFEEKSLDIIDLEDGVFALVGDTKKEKEVTVPDIMFPETKAIGVSALETEIGERPSMAGVPFGALVDRETSALVEALYSILNQSAGDPKKRKAAIMTVIESYKEFMSAGLDMAGNGPVEVTMAVVKRKSQGHPEKQHSTQAASPQQVAKKQEGTDFLFALTQCKELGLFDNKPQTEIDELTKKLKAVETLVTGLTMKTVVSPSSETDDDAGATKHVDAGSNSDEKIFSGLLFE